jgi:membrane peptidoglycan carboxypeptidase
VTATKMTAAQSKQHIITAYLNIIYFGRSAYGIKDAATAYFNKPVSNLAISEAAMLGGSSSHLSAMTPRGTCRASKTGCDRRTGR